MFIEIIREMVHLKAVFTAAYEIARAEVARGELVVIKVEHRTRSNEQNKKMWAMLKDVSEQVEWYGQKLTDDEWKDVFTAGLRKERVVPGINGGFVVLGRSTSKMSIGEMRDLIEVMQAFGNEQGVRFKAPKWMEDHRG